MTEHEARSGGPDEKERVEDIPTGRPPSGEEGAADTLADDAHGKATKSGGGQEFEDESEKAKEEVR